MTEFTIEIDQVKDYEYRVRFDNPEHPGATQLLAAAIGQCLSASLLMCVRKSRVETGLMRTRVKMQIDRSDRGRLRVKNVDVEIDPAITEADQQKAHRCVGLFEHYCTVSQSIREGFPINVSVKGLA
jgi:uncharacterized OsmC-like protein